MADEIINANAAEFASDQTAITEIMDQVPEPGETAHEPPPPPAEPVPEAEVTLEPVEPNAETDEDLDKQLDEIQPKPGQEKGFSTLKGKVKEERTARKAAERERDELKEKLNSVKELTPEVEEELKELKQYRRIEDPTKDPEFKSKYHDTILANNTSALDILKSHRLDDKVAKLIEDAGGVSAIAQSEETVPSELGGDKSWADWLEDVIFPRTPTIDRERIKALILQNIGLNESMGREIQDARTNAQSRTETKIKQAGEAYKSGVEETIKSLGVIAQEWTYPEKATPEDKERVDTHNARLKETREVFSVLEKDLSNPKTIGKLMVTAAQAVYLTKVNENLMTRIEAQDKTIKEQEERLTKIKGSSSSARKKNAVVTETTHSPNANVMDSKKAVNELLKEY